MFLDRAASAQEVRSQYAKATSERARVHTVRAARVVDVRVRGGGRVSLSSNRVACGTGEPIGSSEPAAQRWSTRRSWAGTCRQLIARTEDGAVYGGGSASGDLSRPVLLRADPAQALERRRERERSPVADLVRDRAYS